MTLSDLASLGSVVSGVAVLASLVFLYFQMRQMTEQVRQAEQNQRALISQGTIDRIGNIVQWFAEPHIADLNRRASEGETKFTHLELMQLSLRVRRAVLSAQDSYVHYQAGLLDRMTYEQAMIALRGTLRVPAFRAVWKINREGYAPEWAAIVDREIAGTPVAKPADLVEQFNRALAELAH